MAGEKESLQEQIEELKHKVYELERKLSGKDREIQHLSSRLNETEKQLTAALLAMEPEQKELSDAYLESDDTGIQNQNSCYGIYSYLEYCLKTRAELIREIKRVCTVSTKRAEKIRELQKELKSKKYAQYTEEGKLDYLEMEQKIRSLENVIYDDKFIIKQNKKYTQQLEQMLRQYTGEEDILKAIDIATEQIEERNKLKKVNQKKQGRPSSMDDRKLALILELHSKGKSQREIASQVGYSAANINKILKQHANKNN